MEEKNKEVTKMSLSTLLLLIAIVVIVIMGMYIYQLKTVQSSESQKSAALETEVTTLNNTIDNLQTKIDMISNIVNSNNPATPVEEAQIENTTNKTININPPTQEKIKSNIQEYLNIRQTMFSNTIFILNELKLKEEYPNPEDFKGFKQNKPYPNSYFLITDIKYTDFEKELTKYVTMDLFEKQFPDYITNKDGFLCIYSDGGSTGRNTIKNFKIIDNNSNILKCDVTTDQRHDDDGSTEEFNYTITVTEINGNYVVSDFVVNE